MINPQIMRRQLTLVRPADSRQPNLHFGEMKEACRLKPKQLREKFGLTELTTKDGKKMWFKDNNSKVLFVAHLDSVQNYYELDTVKLKEDTWIFCPTLDDRLGVYVGLYWLPKAGIKPDILLTTDEEKMKSTGHWFNPPKDYNWMFMFDRRGDGAVVYQYDDPQLRYKLGKHGFTVDLGSYSCIKDMDHLGCAGINFGVGYEMNHSNYAYASRKVLESQLRKFRDFWKEFNNTRMPWKDPYVYSKSGDYREFATNVDKHVKAFKERSKIGPSEDLKDYGDLKTKAQLAAQSAIQDAEFEVLPAKDNNAALLPAPKDYRDIKTMVLVDKKGKLTGYMGDRRMWKLYWDTDTLPIDRTVRLILRTQWKANTLYDLCKLSPYKLVSSGYITAKDADTVSKAMFDAGFGMPFNVQGLMTPDQYALQRAVGYRARARAIQPVPVEKRMMDAAKRLNKLSEDMEMLSAKWKAEEKKEINLYPLPTVDPQELKIMVTKSRELVKDGYPVNITSQCSKCKEPFMWDFMKIDVPPDTCPNCITDENQLSLFPAIKKDEGGSILTKIILEKKKDDKTEFKYLGKDKGVGIERFGWVDVAPEKRVTVGFAQ